MSREGPGWCPFAEQIEGVTTSETGGLERVGFCDHTAGGFYSTLRTASFWNGAGTSVHFAVARDGRVCQLVNIFDRAFAQGQDARGPGHSVGPDSPGVTWVPFAAMGKRNPNLYLISTEHEDAMSIDGETRFAPGSEWTPEQYAADLKIKRWCVEEVAVHSGGANVLRFGLDSLAGHHMFDPVNRAGCPGRFWRESYRQMLYDDLIGGNMPERIWLFGNEQAGEEVVGNQIFVWHRGVIIDKVGDEEGDFPGRRLHNEGGVFVEKEP